MQQTQAARHEEPFFNLTATGDDFENALKNAVRENARSMVALQLAIRACMASLKADGMQCEQALLTMKAFVKDACGRHKRRGSREMMHSDIFMEQVVHWCISEFYSAP
jgi:hypothetical protein